MRKRFIGFVAAMAGLVLAGCDFSFSIRFGSSSTELSPSPFGPTSHGGTSIGKSEGSPLNGEGPYEVRDMMQTYKDLGEENMYGVDYCPSYGRVNLLVIPVWFSDSTSFIDSSKRENVRSDIRKAYFGTAEETGWHSVSSYYFQESFGSLTLQGTVSTWYEVEYSYANFATKNAGQAATMALVHSATDWFFRQNPSQNRKDYDYDSNGWLDGVMLIYAAPDYMTLDNRRGDYSNLWAYCYWADQEVKHRSASAPGANAYFWASYDFLYSSSTAYARAGSTYGAGDTRRMSVDTHTYIHEMGHVLGLDDYYDYGPNDYRPAGGFSMQDNNVGGHDPFSVMALGWAAPYIPYDSCTLTLRPFQQSHDLILLSPGWNSFDSPFDEYLLLELYTPTGLNEMDARYTYLDSFPSGASATGVRLWHVDARLTHCDDVVKGAPVMSTEWTSDVYYDARYGMAAAFTNSYGSKDYCGPHGAAYQNFNLLDLIHNNTRLSRHNWSLLSNDSLFRNGDSFSMETFRNQFANGSSRTLDNGLALGWSFDVSISGSGDNATATIDLHRG